MRISRTAFERARCWLRDLVSVHNIAMLVAIARAAREAIIGGTFAAWRDRRLGMLRESVARA